MCALYKSFSSLYDLVIKSDALSSLQYCRSPLHVAVEKNQTEIVNILITHGANVDSVRKYNL